MGIEQNVFSLLFLCDKSILLYIIIFILKRYFPASALFFRYIIVLVNTTNWFNILDNVQLVKLYFTIINLSLFNREYATFQFGICFYLETYYIPIMYILMSNREYNTAQSLNYKQTILSMHIEILLILEPRIICLHDL